MSKKKLKISKKDKFLYNLRGIKLITWRYSIDLLMAINEYLFFGLLDTFVQKVSNSFNHSLIRYQLEAIGEGFSTGISVESFDIASGCWIATVKLADDIANDPLIVPFVLDVVSYATGAPTNNISATKVDDKSMRIVVGDERLVG